MQTLDIIGCGKLGRVVGRSLEACGAARIGVVVNRSLESAKDAIAFMGGGQAVDRISDLRRSEALMLSCSDDSIEACCSQAVEAGVITKGTVVFHCSGAYSSSLLANASEVGASIGSFHAMKSFADPQMSFSSVEGTHCGIEGDKQCVRFLAESLGKCGMHTFDLSADTKILYHAGAVVVCNYLVALLEAGLRCFEAAGLTREHAAEITRPFIDGTIENVMRLGTVEALTGPIARGDTGLVEKQYAAVRASDFNVGDAYKALGRIAVQLSEEQGSAAEEDIALLRDLFR